MKFNQKIAPITGGSRGLGKNMAVRLTAYGADAIITSQTALGRVGVPDDIGGVGAFLCSDDARWLNGQRLEVYGDIFL
jgi:NAD(P)-dependent dehydrogenase (short-subunit alcohol dehydrogenase family)